MTVIEGVRTKELLFGQNESHVVHLHCIQSKKLHLAGRVGTYADNFGGGLAVLYTERDKRGAVSK